VRVLQTAGQFEASIEPLRKILAEDAAQPEGNYRLGVALVQTGRPSLAIWPLKKATRTDEFGTQAGLLLASTLLSTQAYEEAIRAASNVLEDDPDRASALLTRARASILSQKAEDALADAEHLLELRPDDSAVYKLLGRILVDLERHEEAEATWIQFKEISATTGNPDQAAQGCGSLALYYQGRSENDKAEAGFVECLTQYPTHSLLQGWASDFFTATERPEKAIEVWQASVDATPEDLNLRSKLADALFAEKRHEEAESLLLESVDLFDTTHAWQLLSNYYKKANRITEAREALEKALERTRREPEILRFALADLLIEEGELERAEQIANEMEEESYQTLLQGAISQARGDSAGALELLESGLRLWPNNAGARYIAGRAAQDLGDYPRAISEFREAVRVGVEETDAAYHLAAIYFSLGNYPAAAQFAERQIQKRPYSDAGPHIVLIRAASAVGNYTYAMKAVENLKLEEPESATPSVELAGILRASEGPDAAVVAIEKSGLDLTLPANVAALRSLSEDYLALSRTDEALTAVVQALEKHPDDPGFLDIKARLLVHLGRGEEARAALDKALAVEPEFAPALEVMGTITAQAGDHERALALFKRATEADKSEPENPYKAAQTAAMLGRIDEAKEFLRTSLQRSPGHLGACNDLAWYLADEGEDLDYAFELAQRAIKVNANADTLDTLGWVQFKREKPEAAEKAFNLALQKRPNWPSTQYRLGLVFASLGRSDQAQEILKAALREPIFPEADMARAELARLQGS
jgi:tetratricopeptide (TPR) repeat protein